MLTRENIVIKTGHPAVDMISACLDHYKKYKRKVKLITLNSNYWRMFKEYVLEQKPDLVIEDAIDFKNVRIEKGSIFQTEPLRAIQ